MDPTEALDRLHRAGWSVGETCAGRTWLVCSTNGDIGLPYCLLRQ